MERAGFRRENQVLVVMLGILALLAGAIATVSLTRDAEILGASTDGHGRGHKLS